MIENTPNPPNDCQKEIDRYIVWPAQATGYKIGMLTILKLREKCKQALKEKFDIKEFHEIILTNGPIPLNILENENPLLNAPFYYPKENHILFDIMLPICYIPYVRIITLFIN